MANKSFYHFKHFFLIALGLLTGAGAWAGLGTSLMQTADVKKPGEYEVKAQADIIFNHGGGFNFSPHFMMGLVENLFDLDLFLGTGTTDFQVGGLVKFNLLPDIPDQVGLSFLGGASYIHDSPVDGVLVSTGVVVSKRFTVDFGSITPYSALQVEPFFNNIHSIVAVSLDFGARWVPTVTNPFVFYSEFSANLNNSVWALDFGAGYPF